MYKRSPDSQDWIPSPVNYEIQFSALLYVLKSLCKVFCHCILNGSGLLQINHTSSIMVVSSNTGFALELLRTLSQGNSTGNIFISPLSISSALSMVYLGAKGATAAQMAQVSILSLYYVHHPTSLHNFQTVCMQ